MNSCLMTNCSANLTASTNLLLLTDWENTLLEPVLNLPGKSSFELNLAGASISVKDIDTETRILKGMSRNAKKGRKDFI